MRPECGGLTIGYRPFDGTMFVETEDVPHTQFVFKQIGHQFVVRYEVQYDHFGRVTDRTRFPDVPIRVRRKLDDLVEDDVLIVSPSPHGGGTT